MSTEAERAEAARAAAYDCPTCGEDVGQIPRESGDFACYFCGETLSLVEDEDGRVTLAPPEGFEE